MPPWLGFGSAEVDVWPNTRVIVHFCYRTPKIKHLTDSIKHAIAFWALPKNTLENWTIRFVPNTFYLPGPDNCPRFKPDGVAWTTGLTLPGEKTVYIVLGSSNKNWDVTMVHELGHFYCDRILKLNWDSQHQNKEVWDRVDAYPGKKYGRAE